MLPNRHRSKSQGIAQLRPADHRENKIHPTRFKGQNHHGATKLNYVTCFLGIINHNAKWETKEMFEASDGRHARIWKV